jgi:polar amino acid transport system substrate-binding protein
MNLARWPLLAAAAALAVGCAGSATAPSTGAREALAPSGKLRVAINTGNPVLAKRDPASGDVTGITMDLGRMLAKRVGAEFVPVLYPNPGALVEGAKAGAWDVGFAAVDRARADVLEFTAPYMEVNITYLVPSASPVRAVADADRAGVRIGVGTKNAADLYLTRTLKQAQLVRIAENIDSAVELLRSGKADLFASNRAGLIQIRDKLGGYRLLDERLYAVEHAIALPRGRGPALADAKTFVEEAKRSGAVAQAIARHSIVGVEVAPPARN